MPSQTIVVMNLCSPLALRVLRKDDLLQVAGSSLHGGYALVMKLLVYHMILDQAMKSLSALTLEPKERMMLLPLIF